MNNCDIHVFIPGSTEKLARLNVQGNIFLNNENNLIDIAPTLATSTRH